MATTPRMKGYADLVLRQPLRAMVKTQRQSQSEGGKRLCRSNQLGWCSGRAPPTPRAETHMLVLIMIQKLCVGSVENSDFFENHRLLL